MGLRNGGCAPIVIRLETQELGWAISYFSVRGGIGQPGNGDCHVSLVRDLQVINELGWMTCPH